MAQISDFKVVLLHVSEFSPALEWLYCDQSIP